MSSIVVKWLHHFSLIEMLRETRCMKLDVRLLVNFSCCVRRVLSLIVLVAETLLQL